MPHTNNTEENHSRLWFEPRLFGPLSILVLVLALVGLWIVMLPSEMPLISYIGQMLGAVAVLLMSIGLVLISTLPWVEQWFDGIDRAAIWHRSVMIAGIVILFLHIALASNPNTTMTGEALAGLGMSGLVVMVGWAILPRWRMLTPVFFHTFIARMSKLQIGETVRKRFGGYEVWRSFHRTTGLFLAMGFLHGLLDGTAFSTPVLRWSYVVIGGIGLGFYAYRELLSRYFVPTHDYQVEAIQPITGGLNEIIMRPLGRRLAFVPGQFALLYLEGKDGWHRHPFTISSAPSERNIRVTVKALGDFTTNINQVIEPGMPAVIGNAHGRFDHRRGTQNQIWVAGGVGIAPFLSWLRATDTIALPKRIDLFYTAVGPAPFSDEIKATARQHASLRVHIIDSAVDGRLTTEQILASLESDPRDLSVFMCGPGKMVSAFQRQLVKAGVSRRHIHYEYFDLR